MVKLRRTECFWFVGLLALFLVIALSKGSGGTGGDFRGYYAAGRDLRAGAPLYHPEQETPYKYSPLAACLLAPFSFFSFSTGKYLFLIFMCLVLAWLPLALLRRVSDGASGRMAAALGLGLLGSLRFVDNEIHAIQANFYALGLIVLAYLIWTSPRLTSGRRAWSGAVLFGCGALFKFHPFFALGAFLSSRGYKTVGLLGGVALVLAALPNPSYWAGYSQHMEATNGALPISQSTILQGVYPFFGHYFGVGRSSLVPLALWALLALPLLALVPKFDLFVARRSPERSPGAFLLTSAALLLMAVSASPIPWQHTYMILWAFIPASYVLSTAAEARALLALCLLMGGTARGLIGRTASDWLELHQGVFLLALAFVFLFAWQGRRLALASE